jgi:alanine racemase
MADAPSSPVTSDQLRQFAAVRRKLDEAGIRPPVIHAANSAAAIAFPESRFDLVRVGIATYGIAPSAELAGAIELRPAMRLAARVGLVKRVAAGEGISYGHRHHFSAETTVATIPIGYADGVRRALGLAGGEVLIRGQRRPIVGVVTMDQLTVDCGDDDSVAVGDEVVLIGAQGEERITAEEWAERLDTIGYEIVCGIGARVPRRYPRPC